jgi:hypothetical protein
MVHTTATIEAGSFSRLSVYEECARRGELAFCKKIPEPDRGPPHKGCPINPETKEREWHNDRGTRIHNSMDSYIRGVTDKFCVELKCLDIEMTNARASFEDNLVVAEDMWCFNQDWIPVAWNDWDNIWMRVKLDIFQALKGTLKEPVEASAIDLKSGKIFGNEVKHGEQLQLYAVSSFRKFPTLKKVHTEIWYSDQNIVKTVTYTRAQGLKFQPMWDKRMEKMTGDVVFKPSPSSQACKYCPYRHEEDGGSGHCDVAVRAEKKPGAAPAATKRKSGKKTTRKKGSRSRG